MSEAILLSSKMPSIGLLSFKVTFHFFHLSWRLSYILCGHKLYKSIFHNIKTTHQVLYYMPHVILPLV